MSSLPLRRVWVLSFVTLMRKRSASFTASALGNTFITSASKRTVSPKLLRPGPIFLTRKFLRSYSGRSSSSFGVVSFFIGFSFCRCGFPGADQSCCILPFCVGYDQQAAIMLRLPYNNITILVVGMIGIIEIDIEWIIKYGFGLVKPYSMFGEIRSCLLFVPRKFHNNTIMFVHQAS